MTPLRGRVLRTCARATAAAAAALSFVSGLGCDGRPRFAPPESRRDFSAGAATLVELDLSHGVPEGAPQTLFGGSRRTHIDLVQTLRAIDDDRSVRGVFVKLGTQQFPIARSHEIGRMLAKLRDDGRSVSCHADEYDKGALLLASLGCDRLWVSPAGQVEAVGVAAQLIFGRRLLQRLHIEADFLQVGRFKGASEPYTRDEPSDEARASLESVLQGIRDTWVEGIARGRSNSDLVDLVEDGPFAADEAKELGLVDELGYVEDALRDAKLRSAASHVDTRFGGADEPPVSRGIVEALRSVIGSDSGGLPHIALVTATGSISMGGGPGMPFDAGGGITEHDLGRILDRLAKDTSARAVLLRIDSPGGSALASDLLWQKLMKLREVKPLVISIGGMAASGGYYLACAGTKIVAEPTSIVGSIGVVGGKLAFGGTLEEIGVHAETLSGSTDPVKAARAAYMSPVSPWDEATRAKMLTTMTAVYELFVDRIAKGRGLPLSDLEGLTEGRLFAGSVAKERGLVDELGGFDDALRLTFKLAGLPSDTPLEMVTEPPRLLELFGGDEARENRARGLVARQFAGLFEASLGRLGFGEIEAFVGSMAPLWSGERATLAAPYILTLQ